MENRTWKLASGLALGVLALSLGGCQLLGSEKSSEANDSASNPPDIENIIPAENIENSVDIEESVEVEPKASEPEVVAAVPLTLPTDPDARVKAVRKGRSNPFATLVTPKPKSNPEPSRNRPQPTNQGRFGSRSALNNSQGAVRPAPAPTPAPSRPSEPAAQKEEIVLPPLPEATLAKQVTVQGIVTLGAQPQAIIKAPNEDVARTVQAGDFLSDGQILVSSIDVSNPQSPKVILQEAGQTVSIGVGKPAEVIAGGPKGATLSASLPF